MKKTAVITLALTTVAVAVYATAQFGGSKSDPIMTSTKIDSVMNSYVSKYITSGFDSYGESLIVSKMVNEKVNKVDYIINDQITVKQGSKIVISSGSAYVHGTGTVIHVDSGSTSINPRALERNKTYIVAENSEFTLQVTSATAKIMIDGDFSYTNPYAVKYDNYAGALHSMDLFQGTTYGYELTRSATRLEALIMLIRLLGEEAEALAYDGAHNFNDVPSWADKYVAYGYEKGYTKGITDETFGTKMAVRADDYFTFILRALEYEEDVDYTWAQAEEKAIELGIVNGKDSYFYRDFVAYASFNSLAQKMSDGTQTLAQKLIANKKITLSEYNNAKTIVNRAY